MSPYLIEGRLQDVIAAIRVMGSFSRFASRESSKWNGKLGPPKSGRDWFQVCKDHPEFFGLTSRLIQSAQRAGSEFVGDGHWTKIFLLPSKNACPSLKLRNSTLIRKKISLVRLSKTRKSRPSSVLQSNSTVRQLSTSRRGVGGYRSLFRLQLVLLEPLWASGVQ